MSFRIIIPIFLFFCLYSPTIFAQELTVDQIKNLPITHEITQIYDLEMIENDGLLIGDTRLKGGDLDGLLVRFNLKGRVLKEIRLGRTDSYEQVIKLEKTENGYYLLMNSTKGNERRLLFYQLDKALTVLSSEVIQIPNIITASAMTYDAKRKALMIVGTIVDEHENSFPRLITYDLATKKIINTLDFDTVNRPEKATPKPWRKDCLSIQFADKTYSELLLTGLETSRNISDTWIAKVVSNTIAWEDRFATTLGRDKGLTTFKTPEGYLSFGHEYSKKTNIEFSYRTLLVDKNGQEISAERYYKSKNDKFKDVARLAEAYFMMFGHAQTITPLEKKATSSNLWAILVDGAGQFVVQYEHKTPEIDEAHAITRMDNGDMLVLFDRDGVLQIGVLKFLVP